MNCGKILNGVFAVYKPPCITSSATVGRIKEILFKQEALVSPPSLPKLSKVRVGHGGTLDKAAEGVLVIGVGRGCKKLKHYLHGEKDYVAVGVLGVSTDTLDSSGVVTAQLPYTHVSEPDLRLVLRSFIGEQKQVPPLYSALKFSGIRASDLARVGVAVDMKSKERTINIYSIELRNFELPVFEVYVRCSSGTYIRSLIQDIGLSLNCVAHLRHLCRTKHGEFGLEHALFEENWTFEDIKSCLL